MSSPSSAGTQNSSDSEDDHDYSDYEESIKKVKKQNAAVYKLPMEYQRKADVEVKQLLKELDLQLHKPQKLTGNRPLSDNSMAAYQKHFNGLRLFCKLIGDYHSLLILLPQAPEYCPAMDPKTISLFIRYKRGKKDTQLLDHEGNFVVDVMGQEVKCTGGWKDPKNVEQCMSAVGALHASRDHIGPFEDICKDCLDLHKRDLHHGCRFQASSLEFGEKAVREIAHTWRMH